MDSVISRFEQVMMPLANRISGNRYLLAMRDAFSMLLPFIIVGSFFGIIEWVVLDQKADTADVVLLGPQIRHMLEDVKKIVAGKCPVEVIDMRDYGMIRGEKVLDKALKLVG